MIHRGEIWWTTLPEPAGAEPGYRRPVLVVQADHFNRSRISTVVVVAITSNTRLAEAPGNVPLPAARTGLPRDSVANVSQVLTLDKSFLTQRLGTLSSRLVATVEAGLRRVLEL